MNEAFKKAYTDGLIQAVREHPAEYGFTADKAPEVASKMLAAIEKNPRAVNYAGHGFRNACKALRIKPTRKAIFEFIGVAQ